MLLVPWFRSRRNCLGLHGATTSSTAFEARAVHELSIRWTAKKALTPTAGSTRYKRWSRWHEISSALSWDCLLRSEVGQSCSDAGGRCAQSCSSTSGTSGGVMFPA